MLDWILLDEPVDGGSVDARLQIQGQQHIDTGQYNLRGRDISF